MSGPFVKSGELQPSALLTPDLLSKVEFTSGPLSLPKTSEDKQGTNLAKTNFPNDYYTTSTSVEYPNGDRSSSLLVPNVIIYNTPRSVGGTVRYPVAFSRSYVSSLEPRLQQAYKGVKFSDRRFQNTPDYVWVEAKIYSPTPNRPSNDVNVEISRFRGGKKERVGFKGFADFFKSFSQFVAVEGNLTCTMKFQAEVPKGTSLKDGTEAKVIIIPSQFSIKKNVNIPEPTTLGNQRSVTSEQDNADDSFWQLIQNSSLDDKDNDSDEFDEEEED